MESEASRSRIVCRSGNLAILTCGRFGCAPLGDNSGTHQATGVAHHLLFPIGGGSACFLAIRHLADVGISGALPPALAFSAFSRLRLLPCLTVGATTTERGPRAQLFHVLHSIQEDLGPLCYTGSLLSSRRATLESPDSTARHFGSSLQQPRMAGFAVTMLTSVQVF